MVAIVLWTTRSAMNALTFFNNHLDANATFESFAVDGESTSKTNQWAVGEKGKGFILATQYLAQEIDEAVVAKATTLSDLPPRLQLTNGKPAPNAFPPGLSFRVGEQIGELKWKKSRKVGSADSLRLILDDLTTRTVSEYLPHRFHRGTYYATRSVQSFTCPHRCRRCPDGGVPEVYEAAMETAEMRDEAATILRPPF
jgi:hypothetical protein